MERLSHSSEWLFFRQFTLGQIHVLGLLKKREKIFWPGGVLLTCEKNAIFYPSITVFLYSITVYVQ